MPNPDPQRPTFYGKPGRSGRKSLKDELAAHHIAQEIFFKKWDQEDINKILTKFSQKKGRLSVREVMILKALNGNEKMIAAVWDKIAPTKVQHAGAIPVSQMLDKELHDDEPNTTSETGTDDRQSPDHRGQTSPAGEVPAERDPAAVQPPANA